jgi:hypothetical protein
MALFRRGLPPIDPHIEADKVVKETGHQREEWFKLLGFHLDHQANHRLVEKAHQVE